MRVPTRKPRRRPQPIVPSPGNLPNAKFFGSNSWLNSSSDLLSNAPREILKSGKDANVSAKTVEKPRIVRSIRRSLGAVSSAIRRFGLALFEDEID
jgi:hypothetical protein